MIMSVHLKSRCESTINRGEAEQAKGRESTASYSSYCNLQNIAALGHAAVANAANVANVAVHFIKLRPFSLKQRMSSARHPSPTS